MRRASLASLLLALLGLASPGGAQQPLPEDRIMAVVGKNLLLQSQWEEQTAVLASQLEVEPDTKEYHDLARETFDQMLRELVIVSVAERDTAIEVPPERVREEVDAQVEEIQSRFPSAEEFQRQLQQSQWGSLAAYRADLMERKRRELLAQALLQKRGADVKARRITDEEVRAFWEENKARFGARPEMYRFEEIPVTTTPGDSAREETREEAEKVLAELEAGRDFSSLARAYSDDSLSARKGGDLGWFSRGRMVEPFEEAAFAAVTGEIVGPVESPFGYHVLQVLDKREDEVRARHILIRFDIGPRDRSLARAEAERLRDLVLAGADVDSLQVESMAGDTVSAAVLEFEPDRLPRAYRAVLAELEEGEAGIVETPTGFSVVVSRGRGGGGAVTFEEVEGRIRQQLAQQRAEEQFVEQLREEVYVDVRVRPEQALSALTSG